MVQQLVGTLSHRCGRQPSVLQALQHCPLCCHATITWAPWHPGQSWLSTEARSVSMRVKCPNLPKASTQSTATSSTPVLTCFSFRTAQRYCQGEPQGCSKDMLKQSTSSWTTYSWRRDGLFVVTPRYCGLSRTLLGSEMQTLRCVTRYFVFVFCSGGVVFADTGAARTIVC